MKKLVPILVFVCIFSTVRGQNTEFRLNFNSGSFFFSGPSSEVDGMINYSLDKEDGYTNNPFGKSGELGYGASISLSRVTKSNIKFGIDAGFELAKSKIIINTVWLHGKGINKNIQADGKTTITHNFINIFPNLGYRFKYSKLNIDLDFGVDFGYLTKATEKGSAKSDLREYTTSRDRKYIDLDIRPRFQILFSKNKYGGYIGYSIGLKNYKSGFDGGTNIVFSNMFRLGLSYKL